VRIINMNLYPMKTFIEKTDNPNILKFVSKEVLVEGSYSFNSIEETENSPFAKKILQFPFIKQVYITANFIAIEKTDAIDWAHVLDDLKDIVDDYIEGNQLMIANKKEEIKAYSIYAEMTPNPKVMKFVANRLFSEESFEAKNREEAVGTPIFEALFRQFPFVQELFISENYISVSKDNSIEWDEAAMMVREYIFSYLQKGGQIFGETKPKSMENEAKKESFSEVEKKINEILEEYVRPSVANDGGNIDLISYSAENKTAHMILRGACSGCPSSTATLKNGIQGLLNDMMPGVVENVEAVNG
jgi:NFU1 iron-sulfur cluster scaffold homolog, mitochondrial